MLIYFSKAGDNMLHIIIVVLLKLITFGIYYYDYSKTKKLLKLDRTISRQLSLLQKIEVYFFNFYVIAQIFIPFCIIKNSYSTLIHLIGLILTYIHLNRWVFVSKKSIICRDEMFRIKNVYKIKYEKHTLSFKAGSRQYKILFPLVKKEYLEKTIL